MKTTLKFAKFGARLFLSMVNRTHQTSIYAQQLRLFWRYQLGPTIVQADTSDMAERFFL